MSGDHDPRPPADPLRALTRRRFLAGLGAVAAATTAACSSGSGGGRAATAPPSPPVGSDVPTPPPSATPSPSPTPVPGWRPPSTEVLPQAKALAAEVAELLGGSAPDADAVALLQAAGVPLTPALAARSGPLLGPGLQTAPPARAAVRYAQLGGLVPLAVTATYASVMVVLEQHPPAPVPVVRTVDLRLRVTDGGWALDEVASVGGDPVPRPADLPAAAVAVLDHPRIGLPDSARWDVHAGRVDEQVLRVMTTLAEQFSYGVTCLANGHPVHIIDGQGTDRVSSHTRGLALDVWAVDGRPVREQASDPQSPARRFLDAAAGLPALRKIGAPLGWDLDGGTSRVFDDPVHEDHFHLALR